MPVGRITGKIEKGVSMKDGWYFVETPWAGVQYVRVMKCPVEQRVFGPLEPQQGTSMIHWTGSGQWEEAPLPDELLASQGGFSVKETRSPGRKFVGE